MNTTARRLFNIVLVSKELVAKSVLFATEMPHCFHRSLNTRPQQQNSRCIHEISCALIEALRRLRCLEPPSEASGPLALLYVFLIESLGLPILLHPLLDDSVLDSQVVNRFLVLSHVLHGRYHSSRELVVLTSRFLPLGSRLKIPQNVSERRLNVLHAIERDGNRSAILINVSDHSRLLLESGRRAQEALTGELLGVSISGGFLVCRLLSGGVVFGDFLFSAALLVRFEVRFLAGVVAVEGRFAVVAGLEGLGGGGEGVAVGACVGSHGDAGEKRREVDWSLGFGEGDIWCVVEKKFWSCLWNEFDLTLVLAGGVSIE